MTTTCSSNVGFQSISGVCSLKNAVFTLWYPYLSTLGEVVPSESGILHGDVGYQERDHSGVPEQLIDRLKQQESVCGLVLVKRG